MSLLSTSKFSNQNYLFLRYILLGVSGLSFFSSGSTFLVARNYNRFVPPHNSKFALGKIFSFGRSFIHHKRHFLNMSKSNISIYLKQTTSKVRLLNISPELEHSPTLHIVMGNEAADADSIISSICQAYFLSKISGGNTDIYAPILSITAEELLLRRETVILLEMAGIHQEDILYSSDIDLSKFFRNEKLVLTLTDHNTIRNSLQEFGSAVTGILDHHQDLGMHPHVTGESRDIAFEFTAEGTGRATVASCCTQVAELFLRQAEAIEPEVATLLLGVIAIDSANFLPAAGKVTPRDLAAAEALAPLATSSSDDLFELLSNVKYDVAFWNSLSVPDCLRYDYKQFESACHVFGMSSVLCSIEGLAQKDSFLEALQQFQKQKNIELLVIMSHERKPTSRRQLLLFSSQPESIRGVFEYLMDTCAFLELDHCDILSNGALCPSSSPETNLVFFQQKNIKATRKQVAPVLIKYFSNL